MSAIELLEPFLDQGIRNTNFFNGRLLSAEDLRAEQEANRQQHQQLGRAIGEGIAYGLEVRKAIDTSPLSGTTATLVKVSAGLALNRRGQALFLPVETEVALVRTKETLAAAAGLFAACEPPQATSIPTGTGVYILVLAPASGFEGRAPMSGLGGNGATGGSCGSRFAVEGVRFRLIALNVESLAQRIAPSPAKVRNLLAYHCFGTEELADFARDPFRQISQQSPYLSYGPLDSLRALGTLTDCDVPLALLYWTRDGIQYVDAWPVRRRLVKPTTDMHWPLLVGDRRLGEAEAMLLQFQDQIAAIQAEGGVISNLTAEERFAYLPAAGYLPTGTTGLNWKRFLGPMAPPSESQVDAGVLRSIVHHSFFEEPIPVVSFTNAMQSNREPPVPVDVYQIPSQSNVVLFARSTNGRIRVFLLPTTASPQQIYAQTEKSNMQLYAGPRVGNIFPIVDVPSGAYNVDVTAEGFQAITPVSVTVVGGRTTDVAITLQPIAVPPAQPRRCIAMELFGKQTTVCMQPDALTLKRQVGPEVRQLEALPEDVEEWLKAWRDWLITEFPTRGLDPDAVPTILVDADLPRYLSFRDITRKLQLYAEFGEVRVPLSMNLSSPL